MIFWIVAGTLSLVVCGLLALALLRNRSDQEPPAAYDLRVYRDQLKEVDRDLARGVIGSEDAERASAEISRRILNADAQLQDAAENGSQPRSLALGLAVALAACIAGGGVGLYLVIGAPGYSDMPLQTRIDDSKELHATRLSQADFEAQLPVSPRPEPDGDYAALITKLREAVAKNPDDLQGLTLLVRNEANLGNAKAAYTAQGEILRIKGDTVTVDDYLMHAELMINAAQGYVSPEAEESLFKAMSLSPRNKVARYYWGLMLMQNERPDLAFRMWEQLLREGPADAPWIGPIRGRIQELAWRAGVNYQLPPEGPAPKGPSASDVDAASEMTAEERQDMIQGMVTQLSERLATEGGTPQEWARLIGAYAVLGDMDQASAIWAEAQTVFAQAPDALAIVRTGAQRAGLVE